MGAGKVLAVLGANGAGKSSLARAVSGLVRPYGGSVVFAGEEIANWPAHRIRRAGLVHLPEGRGIFRGLTVLDNLRMAAANVHGRHARREAVELALTIFPALATRRRQIASSLSGGEQQMLSLARALASASKLVVADELSLGLAPKMVDLVFDGLASAREAGVTVIMIEQYVHRALAFADECLVLQRGELAWAGPAKCGGQRGVEPLPGRRDGGDLSTRTLPASSCSGRRAQSGRTLRMKSRTAISVWYSWAAGLRRIPKDASLAGMPATMARKCSASMSGSSATMAPSAACRMSRSTTSGWRGQNAAACVRRAMSGKRDACAMAIRLRLTMAGSSARRSAELAIAVNAICRSSGSGGSGSGDGQSARCIAHSRTELKRVSLLANRA